MHNHKVVSRAGCLEARKQFLAKEKEFNCQRDQLSKDRRELPWERVEKNYIFDGPSGKETLAQLFEGRSQLVVYHFMFDPDWEAGCPHCSFWADNFNGIPVHLNHRDVTMLTISRALLAKLEAYRKRMGWSFKWLSSFGSEFNYDYYVSFTPKEVAKEQAYYNYWLHKPPALESVGIGVFHKDADVTVLHTYSCYSRDVDMLNGA
jgi:predicted dithiol-disulfide oxidoreductase (DUF899 family)